MRLQHFLDAAYVTLVDEYQRNGMHLFDVLPQVEMWAAGYKERPVEEIEESAPILESEARQNAQALQQLRAMMMGVG